MGSAVHQSRNYIAKSHLQHGSKSWRGAKLSSDKFEEKYSGWYNSEIISQETDVFGENQEKNVVVYNIQVSVHLNNAAPMIYQIRRRFNHWLCLHEELLERVPTINEKVPPNFPAKSIFKASMDTIHARAEYFQRYLFVLNRDPQLANSPPLLSFLELNSIVQSLSVGTVLNVELTPSHNLQTLKKLVGSLVGVIYLRVDLRLSKIMVKGFIGTPTVTDAIRDAGFNMVAYTGDIPLNQSTNETTPPVLQS